MSKDKATVHINQQFESDLAGYRFYRSSVPGGPYTMVSDPGLTGSPTSPGATLSDFPSSGTWYFVVTAYDTVGNESGVSAEVSKVITLSKVRVERTYR